ncbi:uroporphyrinogen-III synthase [Paeniglutamicibacter sp. MACA_103]|uniref:uroporphyrinogen-III synthase n=1 Tax=Paeniglutamicibacter sp. MACA_103 TaxID=3377337 RepID=UPI0038932039
MPNPGVLAGRTALLLRSADRAAATVKVLAARGARTAVCRLIDFELPADTAELDAHLRRMLSGHYDWCVFTSVNTLTALTRRAAALGLELAIPAGTRVAVVGEATAAAVRSLGAHIDFMPATDHSARGMLADWHDLRTSEARVFAPQADIASSTLRDGFAAHGWDADIVIAYNTVTAPADPARALHTHFPAGSNPNPVSLPEGGYLVEVAQLPAALEKCEAIMFSSPSTVDKLLALVPGLATRPGRGQELIAIGDSTAKRLREHGLEPAGVAALPTPEGLADAWESAVAASTHAASSDAAPIDPAT